MHLVHRLVEELSISIPDLRTPRHAEPLPNVRQPPIELNGQSKWNERNQFEVLRTYTYELLR